MSLVTTFLVGRLKFCGNQYVKILGPTDISVGSNPKPNLNLFQSGDWLMELKHAKNVRDICKQQCRR
jgi:hypothetical protein